MGVLLAYLGLTIVLLVAVLAPLAVGRWLASRDRELEDAEVAAIEASALRMLAGLPPERG